MWVMYDSTTLDAIPADAPAVAGYVGGDWPTYHELARRWPHAKHLSIAVNASEDAECLDIENGDATPADAPGWHRRQIAHGVLKPVLYIERSRLPELVAELEQAGIQRDEYRLWIADYTGQPHITPGADGTQWIDSALGRNLDESLLASDFFRPAPPHGSTSPPTRPAGSASTTSSATEKTPGPAHAAAHSDGACASASSRSSPASETKPTAGTSSIARPATEPSSAGSNRAWLRSEGLRSESAPQVRPVPAVRAAFERLPLLHYVSFVPLVLVLQLPHVRVPVSGFRLLSVARASLRSRRGWRLLRPEYCCACTIQDQSESCANCRRPTHCSRDGSQSR